MRFAACAVAMADSAEISCGQSQASHALPSKEQCRLPLVFAVNETLHSAPFSGIILTDQCVSTQPGPRAALVVVLQRRNGSKSPPATGGLFLGGLKRKA